MLLGSITSRALIACSCMACVFTGFSARLVQLQVTEHAKYVELAAENHGVKQVIHARRGTIRDITGMPLAQNEPVKTVIADGSLIKDIPAIAALLAGPLQMPEAELREKMGRQIFSQRESRKVPSRYIVLKKNVPETTATEIAVAMLAAKERGIYFEQESVRVYPNGQMLCHVLGFTNHESNGADGIEKVMNGYLKGRDGFRYTERDGRRKEIVQYRGQERPARDGCTVSLTIDLGLQTIVEDELDAAMKQYRPKMATVILMRPQTGEILALANRPHYNLNNQEGVPPEHRKNRAVTDQVEPGSTFKIVTTAAALTHKLVTPETVIFCENGSFRFGGTTLRDHHPYGPLTVSDIVVKSSNIGVAKMAIQMGEQRLFEAVRGFGFGERSGVNLLGEIPGLSYPPHRWSKISITRIPMGHEIAATPLQVVTAMATMANGGRLMMPQIIHDIVDDQGTTVQTFPPVEVRRVASEQAANQVRDMLVQVVGKKGTAQLAQVKGFKVAGKTGTAQKAGPNGTYLKGKYIVSFAGFMPAEKPEFVGLVLLDDAVTKPGLNYGGLVAAPIFARIAERAARYLNLQPTEPLEDPAGTEGSKVILTQASHIRD